MKKSSHSRGSKSFWRRMISEFSALPSYKKILFFIEATVTLAAVAVVVTLSFVMFHFPTQVDSAIIFNPTCIPLAGNTTSVKYSGVANTGNLFFDTGVATDPVNGKPVYYAPLGMRACAQRVGNRVYLMGWAWNSNLGWVSFYCPGDGRTNMGIPCGLVKYGAYIDDAGRFYGYAWSNAGWIRFKNSPTPEFGDEVISTSNFGVYVNPASVDGTGRITVAANNGFAWTDTLGWMNFRGTKVPWAPTLLPDTPIPPTDPPLTVDDVLAKDPVDVVDPVVVGGGGGGCTVGVDCPVNLPCGANSCPVNPPNPPPPPWPPAVKDNVLIPKIPDPIEIPDNPYDVTFEYSYLAGGFKGGTSGNSGGVLVSAATVRNAIYKNVFRWKQVASGNCGTGGSVLLKYDTKDSVFYCKGDVYLSGEFTGNKTIIVENGNVFIQSSLFSDAGQLGIIALSKTPAQAGGTSKGNVYIYPEARDLRVSIYADGAVYPFPDPCEVDKTIVPNPSTGACDPVTIVKDGKYLLTLAPTGEPVFGVDQYGLYSPLNGNSNTLFGQLYIQGSIMSAYNTRDKKDADNWSEQIRDFSHLRSVPVASTWKEFKEGIDEKEKELKNEPPTGTFVAGGANSSGGGQSGSGSGSSSSGDDATKKTKPPEPPKKKNANGGYTTTTNKDAQDNFNTIKKVQLSSKLSKSDTKDAATGELVTSKLVTNAGNSGVVFYFEPPSQSLPGFEGLTGGGYKQTGG